MKEIKNTDTGKGLGDGMGENRGVGVGVHRRKLGDQATG